MFDKSASLVLKKELGILATKSLSLLFMLLSFLCSSDSRKHGDSNELLDNEDSLFQFTKIEGMLGLSLCSLEDRESLLRESPYWLDKLVLTSGPTLL